MKKLSASLIFTFLFSSADLQAQTTGEAALSTAKTAADNHWQNWAFAASAVVTAAGAVIAIAVDDGHKAHAH